MTRILEDTNDDGTIGFQERCTDLDSDSLTTSVEWDAVDSGSGFTQKDQDSGSVSWLDYSTTVNTLNNGVTEVVFTVSVDLNGITRGNRYRFEIFADDGSTQVSILRVLDVIDPTGKRLFQTNAAAESHALTEFELSTAWKVDTRSQKNQLADIQTDTNIEGTWIGPNGVNFYALAEGSTTLYWFTLSDEFDITTRSLGGTLDLSTTSLPDPASTEGLFFKPDGSKMYIRDGDAYSFNLTTPYDVTTASMTNKSVSPNSAGEGISIGTNGDRVYLGGNGEVDQLTLTTSWDFESVSSRKQADMGLGSVGCQGLDWGDAGNKFYVVSDTDIIQHSLSTPFEIDTFTQDLTVADTVHGLYIL